MFKQILIGGSVAFACLLGAGCGSSDSGLTEMEACQQVAQITCDKMFSCLDQATLTLAKDSLGLNAADCKTKFIASDCTKDNVLCPLGQKYHADKAAECVAQYKLISCTDVKETVLTGEFVDPAACDLVCQTQ